MSGDISSDDDRPLASSSPMKPATNGRTNGNAVHHDVDMDSDDDAPLTTSSTRPRRELKRKKQAIASDDSSDDDKPLASSQAKPMTAAIPMPGAADATTISTSRAKRKTVKKIKDEPESDEGTPVKKPPRKKVKGEEGASKPARKRKVKEESDVDPSSDDDEPVSKASKKKAPAKKVKKEELDEEEPKPKTTTKKEKDKGKGKEPESSPKKGRKKKEEEDAEPTYRWWEAEANGNEDNSIKWTTLEHHGVLFPPPYEPLPTNVKMKYNGQDVDLPPESEEVAGFFAALLETEHAEDETFKANFFNDWKLVLKDHPPRNGIEIKAFSKCDFRPMFEYMEAEKAKKKALTNAEKKELKKQKDEAEAKYTTCLLDGRKEKVGNYRVEPPGLFRGRGQHPKKGSYKFRVRPEDIIINIGKDAPIPTPNIPGKWGKIRHEQTVTWLATWTENINGSHKYVFLAAGSSLKGQSDMMKFEKARELKNHVDRIRRNYNEDLKSKVMADRQRATAMYFIDKLALRAGNEKGEDEADTVGCCSLRCEHVTLEPPNFVVFDFLGKDSIRYYNRVAVDAQIFKNIRIFKDNKNDDDALFDRVNTSALNKHLNSEMKGLTAKVFRTFNASITFQEQLDKVGPEIQNGTIQEKLNAYNKANRMVAILCNHQRSVPKSHDQSMEKMKNRLRALRYDRMKLRHALFGMDKKYKKQEKYKEEEDGFSDLEDEWIAEHEDSLKAKEIEKAEKKFAKENEKLEEEGHAPQPDATLRMKIKAIEADFKHLESERGKETATLKSSKSEEKIIEMIDKLTGRIKTAKLQMTDRDEGKEVALSTSKINYLDPRITAAWCKIHDVPIEKLFSKTLIVKFPWALEVDQEWKF